VTPRKPLGKALVRDDATLERISEITPDDFDAVLAEVEPATRALLDAKPAEDEDGDRRG
jgi:hypothetical protein